MDRGVTSTSSSSLMNSSDCSIDSCRASQTVPLTVSNFSTEDGFHFPKHHSQLRDGIFFVGGYGQAVFLIDHEVVTSPGKRPLESERPQPENEFFPFTRRPGTHGGVSCLGLLS